MPRGMNQLKPMIIILLMLTSALAGCTGTDGADVNESRISELELEIARMAELITLLQKDINWANNTVNWAYLNLEGDRIAGADLTGANLTGTNMAHAEMPGCILKNANLYGANLEQVNLGDSDLSYANLSYADLTGAILSDANLSNANLSNADLSNAYLGNANLTGADLSDADLYNVRWLFTICPDGTNSGNNGGTCVNNL